jgi:O-antigen/teichoic acid export membrane protein
MSSILSKVKISEVIQANVNSARVRRLWGELFWVGLGQLLAALGGIVGVRLLTHFLTPISYGELALGMTVVSLTQHIFTSPLAAVSLRFFAPARESNQLHIYLSGVRVLLIRASLILVGVVSLFSLSLWLFNQLEWLELMLASFAFSLLDGYSSSLNGMQNAARQRMVVAWHDGLAQWSRFLIAIGVIMILGPSSSIAMLGYTIGAALVLGSQFLFFRRKIFPLSNTQTIASLGAVHDWIATMSRYAMPFIAWGVFVWAQLASARWALQIFSDTSQVGLYAVLYQLGFYPVVLFSTLINQLTQPILFSHSGNGTDPVRLVYASRLNKMLVVGALLFTVFITSVAFLTHPWIFALLVGPEYQSVSSLLPLMVLSGGFYACGQIASQQLLSSTNTQSLILPKVLTALLGVALNMVGAYLLGIEGVAMASIIFALTYFVWVVCLNQALQPSVIAQ